MRANRGQDGFVSARTQDVIVSCVMGGMRFLDLRHVFMQHVPKEGPISTESTSFRGGKNEEGESKKLEPFPGIWSFSAPQLIDHDDPYSGSAHFENTKKWMPLFNVNNVTFDQ